MFYMCIKQQRHISALFLNTALSWYHTVSNIDQTAGVQFSASKAFCYCRGVASYLDNLV